MKPLYRHISVMQKEVVDYAPPSTRTILDCTLGGGGHSHRLLEKYPKACLYGIDRDAIAVKAANRKLQKNYYSNNVTQESERNVNFFLQF